MFLLMHKPPPTPEQKRRAAEIKAKTDLLRGGLGDDQRPNILESLNTAMSTPIKNLPGLSQPAEPIPPMPEDTRGKSRHPDYVRIGVVLHKDTRKYAARLWEDMEPKKDLSDLIEVLLRRFIQEQQQRQS